MKRQIFFLLCFMVGFLPQSVFSQKMKVVCSIKASSSSEKYCTERDFSLSVREMLDDVVNTNLGNRHNFVLLRCGGINNAFASYSDEDGGATEFIGYDPKFLMGPIKDNKWYALFILAHEAGHHIMGFNRSDPHANELIADGYAGWVLAKLGADVNQAQGAMNNFGSQYNSDSHPNKFIRMMAIANGWRQGRENLHYTGLIVGY